MHIPYTHEHMFIHICTCKHPKLLRAVTFGLAIEAGSLSVRQENVAAVYYSPFDNCNICSHSDFRTASSPHCLSRSSHTCFQSSIKFSLNRPSCSSPHFFFFPRKLSVSPKSKGKRIIKWESTESQFPSKVLEQKGQIICNCSALKTFVCEIRRWICEARSKFQCLFPGI